MMKFQPHYDVINIQRRRANSAEHFHPNTFRVISTQAENVDHAAPLPVSFSPYVNVIGQMRVPRPTSEHRHNQPNPRHVGFLRQDVRLLNEPICDVHTESTQEEQNSWWPSRASIETLTRPERTLDTTSRNDYQFRGTRGRTLRHTANPNVTPALGSVPVNHLREPTGKQRFWSEGISYEHQFNSRSDPSYPIRAKRHGSFVWNRMQEDQIANLKARVGSESTAQAQSASNKFDTIVKAEAGKEYYPPSTIHTLLNPAAPPRDTMVKVD